MLFQKPIHEFHLILVSDVRKIRNITFFLEQNTQNKHTKLYVELLKNKIAVGRGIVARLYTAQYFVWPINNILFSSLFFLKPEVFCRYQLQQKLQEKFLVIGFYIVFYFLFFVS